MRHKFFAIRQGGRVVRGAGGCGCILPILLAVIIFVMIGCTSLWQTAFPRQYDVTVWKGDAVVAQMAVAEKDLSEVNGCLFLRGGDMVYCSDSYKWEIKLR